MVGHPLATVGKAPQREFRPPRRAGGPGGRAGGGGTHALEPGILTVRPCVVPHRHETVRARAEAGAPRPTRTTAPKAAAFDRAVPPSRTVLNGRIDKTDNIRV